jgi:endo-1,4-beta-xylanase
MKKSFLFLFSLILLVSCKKNNTTPTPVITGDGTLAGTAPFKVGCAIDPNLLKNNAAYRAVVLKEYNSITVENSMKWSGIHPSQNVYNFTDADYVADFCATNNKRFFGHNLLWHGYNPTWLETYAGDSTAFENLLKTHIQTVVGRYKGKAIAWDVVNEVFKDDNSGALRTSESIWARKLGPDYVARAFKYAHDADPNALLFLNDYSQENNYSKLDGIKAMAADFKKRGIPINGLGLQMHIGINSDENGILAAISECAKTGLLIHISELDISVNSQKDATLTMTPALQEKQRIKYKKIVSFYKGIVPVAQQFGITNWNVGDGDSWLRGINGKNEFPLLFDEKYEKKPAYTGYLEGLQ